MSSLRISPSSGFLFSFALFAVSGSALGFGSANDNGTAGFKSLQINAAAAPEAVGGAFAAVIAELDALGINPAGIAGIKRRTVTVAGLDYVLDTARYLLSAAIPTSYGVVAININDMYMGEFERTSTTAQTDGTFSANDIDIQLAYGRRLAWKGQWDLGVAARFISSTIERYSAQALGLDLGVIYKIADGPSLAFSVTNLGTALSNYDGLDDSLPTSFRLGFAHYLAHLPVRITADATFPRDANIHLSLGVQVHPVQPLFIRVGYRSLFYYDRLDDLATGESTKKLQFAPSVSDEESRQAFGLSFGLGLQWLDIKFDYAHTVSDVFGGVNRFGLGYNF